jgi:hypothetical protein
VFCSTNGSVGVGETLQWRHKLSFNLQGTDDATDHVQNAVDDVEMYDHPTGIPPSSARPSPTPNQLLLIGRSPATNISEASSLHNVNRDEPFDGVHECGIPTEVWSREHRRAFISPSWYG